MVVESSQSKNRTKNVSTKLDVALGDLAKTKVAGRGFGEPRERGSGLATENTCLRQSEEMELRVGVQ